MSSTPSRPRVLNTYASTGTPRRAFAAGALPQTPGPAARSTSIKDQIRALRQAAATPPAGTPRARERREAVRQLVRKAADTGRLVLPPHIPGSADSSVPLAHLPIALYTLLLGIPALELSRKPPAASATKSAASPFPAARAASSSLDGALDALALGPDADEDDVFGERQEEENVGGFIGGRDLEVLKVAGQALESLDLELGLFGGLRALDVRDNRLEKLPSSLPHLGLLTTLTLSHNKFSDFPTLLALLPLLAHLDLSNNGLTTLAFTLPTRAPMFPESFASPPPAPDAPSVPFPALRTLLLENNALELARLPSDGWPASLDALHLQGNPLFPARGGGPQELDLAKSFRGAEELRHLGLEGTGVASLSPSGRTSRPSLQVVNLSSNPGLIVVGLDAGWTSHPSGFLLSAKESGEAHPGKIELVLDAHLLPDANGGRPKRHVYVPPSPEGVRTTAAAPPRGTTPTEVDEDPFWSSKARDKAAATARRNGGATAPSSMSSRPPTSTAIGSSLAKPLAAFDDWDPPALSASRSTTPSRASTFLQTPTAAASADAGSIFTESYSANSQTFQLAAASKTPMPSLPAGAFSISTLLSQPYASDVRAIALSGRQIRSFSDVPTSGSFPALEALSITQCPVHLTPLAPALPILFPGLRILDVSESSVADALFASATVMRALLLEVGVRVIRARESGVRSLTGLEEIAQEFKQGAHGEWRCEEIDLQDNLIEQLPPILGHLPVQKLLVDRNLFRSPNRRVWERDGTVGLLAWLRESS